MITYYILRIIADGWTAILSLLPNITTLPTIGGYDIDGAMVGATGFVRSFVSAVWVIQDVFIAAAVLYGYYGIKILARLLLGHRAPP